MMGSWVMAARYSRRGDEMTRFSFRVIRAYADFDSSPERHEPNREPVDGHAFHPAAKNLGEGGLVRAAAARGLQLREFAPLDGFINGQNESALRGEFRRFGRRKANVNEHVTL